MENRLYLLKEEAIKYTLQRGHFCNQLHCISGHFGACLALIRQIHIKCQSLWLGAQLLIHWQISNLLRIWTPLRYKHWIPHSKGFLFVRLFVFDFFFNL